MHHINLNVYINNSNVNATATDAFAEKHYTRSAMIYLTSENVQL